MVSGYGRYKDKTETHVQRIAIESFLLQLGFHGSRFCDVYVTFRGKVVASAVCCCRPGLNRFLWPLARPFSGPVVDFAKALFWSCCGLCFGPSLALLWPLIWPFCGPVVAFALALLPPPPPRDPSLALLWP